MTTPTPTPEAIPTEAIEAARAALEQRLSWASLDWPNLYPNMIDAIIGTVVPAAAPFIAAQALRDAAEHITDDYLKRALLARSETIEGKSE